MINDKLSFLPNNVKRTKVSGKILKLFEYFRNVSSPVEFLGRCRKIWNDDFQGQLFFHTVKNGIAIGYYGKESFELLNKHNDKSGQLLIIEVKIENDLWSLINLCNANTGNKQFSTISHLINMLEKIHDINNKSIVFGGDFNLFFEIKLEGQGENPVLKKTYLAKLIQIRKNFV